MATKLGGGEGARGRVSKTANELVAATGGRLLKAVRCVAVRTHLSLKMMISDAISLISEW